MCEAFIKIGELAFRYGYRNIKETPGLFKMDIDKNWKVEINPHEKEINHIPPYNMAVLWNGWIAGIFSAHGGDIVAGSMANENTLIDAINKAMEKLNLKFASRRV